MTANKIKHVAQILCECPKPSVNISISQTSPYPCRYANVFTSQRRGQQLKTKPCCHGSQEVWNKPTLGEGFQEVGTSPSFCLTYGFAIRIKGHKSFKSMKITWSTFYKKGYRKTSKRKKDIEETELKIPFLRY